MANLTIRKLADQSVERTKIFDPLTGEPILMEPDDAQEIVQQLQPIMSGVQASPYPFLGIEIVGEVPDLVLLPTSFVAKGKSEGWIEVEGGERVHRSSGPLSDPWGTPPHTFIHYDRIVIKTVNGDLSYKVIENPDKWPDEKDEEDESGHGGEVKWVYSLELEDSNG